MGDSSRAHQRETRERGAQWCCDGAREKACARDSRDFVVTLGIFVTPAANLKIVSRRDGLCSTVLRGDAGGLWVNTGAATPTQTMMRNSSPPQRPPTTTT
ncbi:hypothetical protein O3P69_011610 [Scylla paramamosain]|uniref:Uncharacterized protein n=1 Tax=Scylla paramamosain TaxID=85552 RepID=A0AAW0T7I2_SCYPA